MVTQMEGEGVMESCRLCGAQEGKLLHLHDTFSILGTTSTILHLLHSISVLLKVQSECEHLMPHHLCWHCFNTAVDINAFIDSGLNFQKTTFNNILPSQYTRIEEASCTSILSSSEPYESAHDDVFQGDMVEEREIVLEAVEDQINQVSNKAEAVAVEEHFHDKLHTNEENVNKDQEDKEQPEGSAQTSGDANKPVVCHQREKCSYCNKTFRRQSQLKSHLASHSEARPHQCQVCGVAFKHRRNLVEHSHTHSQQPSFICAVCGLTFKQKSNLLKHERTHRRNEVPDYRCELCGSRYSQSSHLRTHIISAHADNPGFQCEHCRVVLMRRSSLRRHMATVHATVSRFKCPHCNKGFTNQQNFQGHVRAHTGERPYKCVSCSKAFTTPKALSRHRMVHQGNKTHKCGQCGKTFLELCDLKRHTKRHIQKTTKRAKASSTNRCEEGAANPSDPNMGSINLMVLTDSLIFTESQQLLDNHQQSRPDQVILPNDKLNVAKDVNSEHALEGEQQSQQLKKKPQVEVLTPGHLLQTSSSMEGVLQPPGMGDVAAPLHPSSQVLQPTTLEVEEASTTPQGDLVHRECSEGPGAPDTPTMMVLASASTPTEYLPDPQPQAGTRANSPVGDVGERVLSHATW